MPVEFRCPHVSQRFGSRRDDGTRVTADEYAKARRTRFLVSPGATWEYEEVAASTPWGAEDPTAEPVGRWTALVSCPECGAEVKVVTDTDPEYDRPEN
jgi:hypothetical protein